MPAVVAARKQAPRSLWDPAYIETSWITAVCSGGPIRLLPRLKDKIAANYPEHAAGHHRVQLRRRRITSPAPSRRRTCSASLAAKGCSPPTLWRLHRTTISSTARFEIFRNYDGANGSFGNTSIRATNSGCGQYLGVRQRRCGQRRRAWSSWPSTRPTRAQTAGIAVTHTAQFHTAQVYTLTSASSAPQRQPDINITPTNAFQYTMPANSVTTLVLLP